MTGEDDDAVATLVRRPPNPDDVSYQLRQPIIRGRSWQQQLAVVRRYADRRLALKDLKFIYGLVRQRAPPTLRQLQWLRDIHERIEGKGR